MIGEANGQAKLTADQVRQIYKLAHEWRYTQAVIGMLFGVSETTVNLIKYRRWWRHLWENAENEQRYSEA